MYVAGHLDIRCGILNSVSACMWVVKNNENLVYGLTFGVKSTNRKPVPGADLHLKPTPLLYPRPQLWLSPEG